jgi:acetylglutamate kinase
MIVLKLGGAALKSTLTSTDFFSAVVKALPKGEQVLIVHGGGPEINQLSERLGYKSEFVNGLRVTSPEHMDVVSMVLGGKVNPALVRGLRAAGMPAVGLCGHDGAAKPLLECELEDPALGLVGKVVGVHLEAVRVLLEKGFVPVVAPIGELKDGRSANVNADLAAAALARALRASKLLFMTDRDGILDSQGAVMAQMTSARLRELVSTDVVSGGMKVKARAILEVLEEVPSCSVEVMNGLDLGALAASLQGRSSGTRVHTT